VGIGHELFVVTDLSDVWVVGDLYEQDFAAVAVGATARITSGAYPDLRLQGKVSYIDPRLEMQSRTAKIRVEVPNPGRRLKLGMYVTVEVQTAGGPPRVLVPRAAIQTLGERQVVFVPVKDEPGTYVQRVVQLGPPEGDRVPVLNGLKSGDEVVTAGSFFLRAESLRNSSER
jgi:RND family efflux transporter MFP subunit